MLEQAIEFIQSNAEMAPYITFGLLLLAGINLPISEDAMLIVNGLLAAERPDLMWKLFLGVYLGAYCSDQIAYSLGRFLGPKLFKIKFFAKFISTKRIKQVETFYKKYGIITLILGRFIPFGVRNALFITAGLGKMKWIRFALSDLTACTISCSVYFGLVYHHGENIIEYIKKGNMIFVAIILLALVAFLIGKNYKTKRYEKNS